VPGRAQTDVNAATLDSDIRLPTPCKGAATPGWRQGEAREGEASGEPPQSKPEAPPAAVPQSRQSSDSAWVRAMSPHTRPVLGKWAAITGVLLLVVILALAVKYLVPSGKGTAEHAPPQAAAGPADTASGTGAGTGTGAGARTGTGAGTGTGAAAGLLAAPLPREIWVRSIPAGAEAVIAGKVVGVTPYLLVRDPAAFPVQVLLRRAGFKDEAVQVAAGDAEPPAVRLKSLRVSTPAEKDGLK
jgi:hypothetical protein